MKLLFLTDVTTANPNSNLKPNSNPNHNLSQIRVSQRPPYVMNIVGDVRIPDYQTIAINIQYTCYTCIMYILLYQHKMTKMRAELANLNHCVVPFLSCAAAKL